MDRFAASLGTSVQWEMLALSVNVDGVKCGDSPDANCYALEVCGTNCGLEDEMCGSSFSEVYCAVSLACAV